MEEYFPFTLRGTQERFNCSGQTIGETYKSPSFALKQGLLMVEIEHEGQGDFKLEFVPAEGFSRARATVATLGSSFAAGAATGAAIGSIVPGAGTIFGGLAGGAAGWFTGNVIGRALGPTIWTALEGKGKKATYRLMLINENEKDCLKPGNYRLEINSESRWACRFIQPDLNQSFGLLTQQFSKNFGDELLPPPGAFVLGPYRSGRRPLLAEVRHDGRESFNLEAFSVDGTHYCTVFQQKAQFYVDDHPTELKPGKEYMLYVYADGPWSIDFREGY